MRKLGLLAALVAVTACGTFHPAAALRSSSDTGTGKAIPWLALAPDLTPVPVPSPSSLPVPPGTPACAVNQLVPGGMMPNGATGHMITWIAFSTSGAAACYLDGTPSVRLLDAAGKDLGFAQRAPYMPPLVTGPALVEPEPAPKAPAGSKPGEARFTIDWLTQPEPCPGQAGVQIASARVQIGTAPPIVVPLPPAPAGYACQGVGVSSFQGVPIDVQPAPVPPLPAIAIQAPATAHSGRPFEFTVTLTDDTGAPLDLVARCPNYEEELITPGGRPLGGKHIYRLNCSPAGTLAGGASATFQMLLDVPRNAAPGAYSLVFNLGYANAFTRFGDEWAVVLTGA